MSPPRIDWRHPGFAPWRAVGKVAARHAVAMPVHQALQALAPAGSMGFVPQAELPAGEAYDAFIHRTATIPTRDSLHDFFNGLVWLAFPQAKRRLNDLQAGEIQRRGIGPTRGPLRDALTLFDEHGAVLDAPPELWEPLLARDWNTLFITRRAHWREARLLIFGHALLEQLVRPRKSLVAHVLLGSGAAKSIAPCDADIAEALRPQRLVTKPFTPLPVMGVPGWCAENQNFCFYDDPKVFRPRRPPESITTATGPRSSPHVA